VKRASAAERKAALEKLAREVALPAAKPSSSASPSTSGKTPEFVKQANPAARKAVVEALARENAFLGRVPTPSWKRDGSPGGPGPSSAPVPAQSPASHPAAASTASAVASTAGHAAAGTVAPPESALPVGVSGKPTRVLPSHKDVPATREAPVGVSPERIVILDTNALMMQFQFHVDIEGELRRILDFAYEIVVPDSVVAELSDLASVASGKDAGEAKMALEFAKHFRTVEAPAEGDAGVLRLAEKMQGIVVTNDKVLRARLRAKNIPNVHLRSRAFLTLEGHVTGT
jgi:rRNA-processing protein FCF1